MIETILYIPERTLADYTRYPTPAAHAGEHPGFRGFASKNQFLKFNLKTYGFISKYLKVDCNTWEASIEPLQPKNS